MCMHMCLHLYGIFLDKSNFVTGHYQKLDIVNIFLVFTPLTLLSLLLAFNKVIIVTDNLVMFFYQLLFSWKIWKSSDLPGMRLSCWVNFQNQRNLLFYESCSMICLLHRLQSKNYERFCTWILNRKCWIQFSLA